MILIKAGKLDAIKKALKRFSELAQENEDVDLAHDAMDDLEKINTWAGTGRMPNEPIEVIDQGNQQHYSHPSFGNIAINERFGSFRLFGSDVPHESCITLRINTGVLRRDLSSDFYSKGQPVIEVLMTKSRFAELITSTSHGEGVPCSIQCVGRKEIQRPKDMPTKSEMAKFEFNKVMEILQDELRDDWNKARDLLGKKGALKAAERKEIKSAMSKIGRHIFSNIPHIEARFDESMRKTIARAKIDIEAFLDLRKRRAGEMAVDEYLKSRQEQQRLGRGMRSNLMFVNEAGRLEETKEES